MLDVLGIGSAFVDYYFDVDESFLTRHSIPLEHAVSFSDDLTLTTLLAGRLLLSQNAAGACPNTLQVLAALGAKTGYYGVIGADAAGDFWLSEMRESDTSRVIRLGQASICVCLLTHKRTKRSFIISINPMDSTLLKNIDLVYINSPKLLFISQLQMNYKQTIGEIAKVLGKISRPLIAVAPSALYMDLSTADIAGIVSLADIVFLNKQEAEKLTNSSYLKAAEELLALGSDMVCITLGEKGAYIATKMDSFHTPAGQISQIVDPTAAGDAFAAGFIYGFLHKKSLRECAIFATKIAAKSLTDYGVRAFTKGVSTSLLSED